MALAAPDPWTVGAAALLLAVFLVLRFLLERFRDCGFTLFEASLVLVVAALVQGLDFPLVPWSPHVVGLNAAGAVIPLAVAARMTIAKRARPWRVAAVTFAVGAVAFLHSEVVPGRGILLTNLAWPALVAVGLGYLLTRGARREAAPTAYAGGVFGALAGLDAARLPDLIAATEAPTFFSIGGAGVGDAVFLLGLSAIVLDVLLFGLARRA